MLSNALPWLQTAFRRLSDAAARLGPPLRPLALAVLLRPPLYFQYCLGRFYSTSPTSGASIVVPNLLEGHMGVKEVGNGR